MTIAKCPVCGFVSQLFKCDTCGNVRCNNSSGDGRGNDGCGTTKRGGGAYEGGQCQVCKKGKYKKF